MNKVRRYTGLLLVIVLLLSGCSDASGKTKIIIRDLETNGYMDQFREKFAGLSIVDGDCDVSCEIIETVHAGENEIIACQVACDNSYFGLTYNLKITYTDGVFSNCQIAGKDIVMKQAMPYSEEQLITNAKNYFAKMNSKNEIETTILVDEDSVLVETDAGNIEQHTTVNVTLAEGILTKKCIYESEVWYSDYDGTWEHRDSHTVESCDWDVKSLAGKKWIHPNGEYFVYIQSVNPENATAMVGYKAFFHASTVDFETWGTPILMPYTCETANDFGGTKDYIQFVDRSDGYKIRIYPDMSTILDGDYVYCNY